MLAEELQTVIKGLETALGNVTAKQAELDIAEADEDFKKCQKIQAEIDALTDSAANFTVEMVISAPDVLPR